MGIENVVRDRRPVDEKVRQGDDPRANSNQPHALAVVRCGRHADRPVAESVGLPTRLATSPGPSSRMMALTGSGPPSRGRSPTGPRRIVVREAGTRWAQATGLNSPIAAVYFFFGWSATTVPPPGIACFSAFNQMLAITR